MKVLSQVFFLVCFVVLLALTGCDGIAPAITAEPIEEVSTSSSPPISSEMVVRAANHTSAHSPPTAPRLRMVYREIFHTLEMRITPPRSLGSTRLNRYEYQVNDAGSWKTLPNIECFGFFNGKFEWVSGSQCLEADAWFLITKNLPITDTGNVTYKVRAVNSNGAGGFGSATVTIPVPEDPMDILSQVPELLQLRINPWSGFLEVRFWLDDVRVDNHNRIKNLHLNLYKDGSCTDFDSGGSGLARRWGDRNVASTFNTHPVTARVASIRLKHGDGAVWGNCYRVHK